MVIMAVCRISASAIENTTDGLVPFFYTPNLKFSVCVFIRLAELIGKLVILTHNILLCSQ
jgi:hypothetical protein